ncbi:hypothetical protein GUITHDRAFT_114125 [Guillardia theta CCMP2712]|uniref:Carbohydrate-binding/sugar hydrolysis domain-containing protein n=1 Tax=Guillardia theta (strain CCMP2712) TaxID=905079 RepID=L1IUF2_GUITC|nr:hypothetical protein GUITHDRAFT_114125 [Guillardia theta CCMP2712]EKX39876.1 hypothetical protein GUITHDRAFT_114125 [Guillardia theta CCMP2712]|eukprot:XP_005826856.1 hypothetical protein GUITHDRAFT_114125 [Guillardia theta CCMP2712]
MKSSITNMSRVFTASFSTARNAEMAGRREKDGGAKRQTRTEESRGRGAPTKQVAQEPKTFHEGKVRVVDLLHGPWRSIGQALQDSLPGDVIAINAGTYHENVDIKIEDVKLVGNRCTGEVTLTSRCRIFANVISVRLENLSFKPKSARVEGDDETRQEHALTRRKMGMIAMASDQNYQNQDDLNRNSEFCVIVEGGRVTVLDCEFQDCHGGIKVCGRQAEVLVYHCKFLKISHAAAMLVSGGARARARGSSFRGCADVGIDICDSECTVDENEFVEMESHAVLVEMNGRGKIRSNQFLNGRKASIAVCSQGDPIVLDNKIENSLATGIFVFEGGKGTFEHNTISASSLAGIEVRDHDSDPMMTENEIHHGLNGGIVIHSYAKGTAKKNRIHHNKNAGITICTNAKSFIVENEISNGQGAGVLVHSQGSGVIHSNFICCTGKAGIEVRQQAIPQVISNKIEEAVAQGIHVHSQGSGCFEENEISRCQGPLMEASDVGQGFIFKNNALREAISYGIRLEKMKFGEISFNHLLKPSRSGIMIEACENILISSNKITDSCEHGIQITQSSKCQVVDNVIVASALSGIDVMSSSDPQVESNTFDRVIGAGICIHDEGKGVYKLNTIRGNVKAGIVVRKMAEARLMENTVIDGKATGIYGNILT